MKINKLHSSAITNLTLTFTAGIAFICLLFSIPIYRFAATNVSDITRSNPSIRRLMTDPRLSTTELEQLNYDIEDQVLSQNQRLIRRIILIDLVLITSGLAGSYYAARRILRPIKRNQEAMERFAADASHELRTPLAVMKTGLEVTLRSDHTKEELRSQLVDTLEEVDKLHTLSNQLLDLSGSNDNNVTEIQLERFLAKELRVIGKSLNQKVNFKCGAKRTVTANPERLRMLVKNILENTHKYSNSNKVDVYMSPDLLTFRDYGPGVEAEQLDSIFERFYRADSRQEGTGLGLSLVKEIANDLGWEVSATNMDPGLSIIFKI
jgi:signal transduction histidine kinase